MATSPVSSLTCSMMASRRAAPLDGSGSVNPASSSGGFGGPSVSDIGQFQTGRGRTSSNSARGAFRFVCDWRISRASSINVAAKLCGLMLAINRQLAFPAERAFPW